MMRLKRVLASLLVLSPILCVAQQATPAREQESEPPDIQQLRARYFARLRGAKPGEISVEPRLKALKQLEEMRRKEKQLLQSSPPAPSAAQSSTTQTQGASIASGGPGFNSLALSTTQWTPIGPSPLAAGSTFFSGRVESLAVNPTNPAVIYLGAADGGVWKTTDSGQHWVPLTDTQPSLSMGALAIDPNNPNIIYAGTGEARISDFYPGAGILKSTDGGQTWTNIQGPFLNSGILGMAVDPNNSLNVLVASPERGIQRSTDGGNTWSQVSIQESFAVLFDPNHPGVAYAGGTGVVFKSTDSGATWNIIFQLPTGGASRSSITLSGSTLYAFFSNSTLFKSIDGGSTWSQLTTSGQPFCQGQCPYNLVVGASPTNPDIVYVGSINMYHSNDGGITWGLDGTSHADNHALAFSPDGSTVFSGNDGGAWSASTGTDIQTSIPWKDLNQTLATLQFYRGISMASGDPNQGLGGTQDNGTALYTGSITWTKVFGGDGFSTAINPLDSSIAYATTQGDAIFKSTDGGNTFFFIGPFSGGRFDTLLSIDPSAPQNLYADSGTGVVYQSTNAGSSWQAITNPGLGDIFAINVAPSDSDTVYAATGSGISVTHNATAGTGSVWTAFNSPGNLVVVQVVSDPHDPTTGYALLAALPNGRDGGRIFKLTGSGATWTDITGSLPVTPYTDVVVDPDQANTLYIATDVGIFSTTDGGTTWNTLVAGLPRSVVTALVLDRSTRVLRAATHGRSMWDLQLPPTQGTGAGALSGKVVDISDNTPISGATVSFSGGSTTTDGTGSYQFANVAPGTYDVKAVAGGYFSVTESAAVSSGHATTLNFRLSTGGKLAGTVKSSSNAAIPGATVQIVGGSVSTNLTLTTDSTGAYATGFVPVGNYSIAVSASGFSTQSQFATVNAGQTTTVNFILTTGGGGGFATASVTISGSLASMPPTATANSGMTSFLTPDGSPHVFYIGNNQHVIQLSWTSAGGWHSQDMTTAAGGSSAGIGSGLTSTSVNGVLNVFYIDSNRHVNSLHSGNGSVWANYDLTAIAGSPLADLASPLSAQGPVLDGNIHLFYVAGGHVNRMLWPTSGGFLNQDLTTMTGAPSVGAGSGLTSMVLNNTMNTFFVDSNRHVNSLHSGGPGVWADYDLTAIASGPLADAGSPLSSFGAVADANIHLFYVAGGHVNRMVWPKNGGFLNQDLTSMSGAPSVAAGSGLTSMSVTNSLNTFYIDVSRHVNSLHNGGDGAWSDYDLTALAGSGLADLGDQLTSLGPSGDANLHLFYVASSHMDRFVWPTSGSFHNEDLNANMVFDSGTVSLTIGSFTATACYGASTNTACSGQPANNTAAQVASALAQAINVSSSPATAVVNGATLTLTWKVSGNVTTAVSALATTHDQPSVFGSPSFTSPATNFSGGH